MERLKMDVEEFRAQVKSLETQYLRLRLQEMRRVAKATLFLGKEMTQQTLAQIM